MGPRAPYDILADVDLIDAQIAGMDHVLDEVDSRPVSRALAQALAEGAKLTNRTAGTTPARVV